ncbi:hypothetical protein MOTC310_23925 [Methylobacterium oryzae]|uniref:MoaB/Mog domain-containing protein n=1 Tax=Methylobacterium oryzae TaxID=334852 RepID=A0ABU7TVW5_9HYPH
MPRRVGTAAVLVIGDEILSGRTREANAATIACRLAEHGIAVREVRIVPDDAAEIAAAVNELRRRYTHLLTTGGIGPTHDDVTADGVARAFGVGIDIDERALAILRARVQPSRLSEARMRTARLPFGADLVVSPMTKAPGFRIGNVFVMAGVPEILQAMLAAACGMLASEGWPRRDAED